VWGDFRGLIESALGRPIPDPAYAEIRPGDQPIFVADCGKAERELGWNPKISPPEGIARLIEWVGEHVREEAIPAALAMSYQMRKRESVGQLWL
jgi:nucleoside-diphosphate-sugar epimerase